MSSTAQPEATQPEGQWSGYFIKGAPENAEQIGDGLSRQILGFGENLMGVRVWFETGAVGEVHSHFHTQMAYVESGKFRVTVGDEETTLSAGDCFFVPSNTPHGAVCLEKGVLIDIFNPARQDFLEPK